MKKNGIALASLALNLVLVALVLWQGSRLDTLEQDLWNVQANLLDRQDQVMDEVDALREDVREGERLIADWSLEPAGLDSETQSLLAEVVLQLRQWGADTSVKLTILTPAGETVQTIPADAGGICRGPVSLALGEQGGVSMTAAVTTEGVTIQEDLGGYEDLFMLLPVQVTGGSFGSPTYRDGKWSAHIAVTVKMESESVDVLDPAFAVYRNGSLVQQVNAVVSRTLETVGENKTAYAPDLPEETFSVEARQGDRIQISFTCKDGFGLGYAFPFFEETIESVTPGNQTGEGGFTGMAPTLTWPE